VNNDEAVIHPRVPSPTKQAQTNCHIEKTGTRGPN
jgi:hypothetical protein